MTEQPETFEAFLSAWTAENIGSLGDRTDPSDWDFIVRRRSDALEEAAMMRGFSRELFDAMQPYGGVAGYVRHKFKVASGAA